MRNDDPLLYTKDEPLNQNSELLCNLGILKNRTKCFSRETSFHQLPNMASSGLKKMFILIILYIHGSVSVNIYLIIFFDWQMLCHIIG